MGHTDAKILSKSLTVSAYEILEISGRELALTASITHVRRVAASILFA